MAKYTVPTTKELLDAGVHFGHQTRRWYPSMEQYIYAVKKNIHIIDLEQTEKLLKNACEFLYDTAAKGGKIIFVGTKRQAREIIEIEAKRCGAFYVSERWLGGTITNFDIIKKNMDKLVDLMRKREAGELDHYTKKERLLIDREIAKLQKAVGGVVGLKKVPDALFIVDAKRERTAVREAGIAKVKIVSLVDTNTDPRGIDYIIPGNDDAIKSIALILKTVADAVEEGYKEYAKKGEAKADNQVVEKKTKKVQDEAKVAEQVTVTYSESPVVADEILKEKTPELEELVESMEEVNEEELNEEVEKAKIVKPKAKRVNVTKKEIKK